MTKKGVETIATVVKIHRDDPEELYVTVRDASGQERQAVWKSNFGRPTPSTRHCPRGRVGSMAWRLRSTQYFSG